MIVNEHDDAHVKEGLREFAQDVIHGLETRFPEDSSSILGAFDISQMEDLPTEVLLWKRDKDAY